jgi:hypothetical protein
VPTLFPYYFNNYHSYGPLKVDVRSKLLNAMLEAVNDANPKIVQTALACMKIFIEKYTSICTVAFNAIYSVLINKLCDVKVSIKRI